MDLMEELDMGKDIDWVEVYHHPDSEPMALVAEDIAETINSACEEQGLDNFGLSIVPSKLIGDHIMHMRRVAIGLHYIDTPYDEMVVIFLESNSNKD